MYSPEVTSGQGRSGKYSWLGLAGLGFVGGEWPGMKLNQRPGTWASVEGNEEPLTGVSKGAHFRASRPAAEREATQEMKLRGRKTSQGTTAMP